MTTLADIEKTIQRKFRYYGAADALEEKVVASVERILSGVVEQLKCGDGVVSVSRPTEPIFAKHSGPNTSKRRIGQWVSVMKDGREYASAITAKIQDYHVTVPFFFDIRKADGLPEEQNRYWSIWIGDVECDLGVDFSRMPTKACAVIVTEISRLIVEQVEAQLSK